MNMILNGVPVCVYIALGDSDGPYTYGEGSTVEKAVENCRKNAIDIVDAAIGRINRVMLCEGLLPLEVYASILNKLPEGYVVVCVEDVDHEGPFGKANYIAIRPKLSSSFGKDWKIDVNQPINSISIYWSGDGYIIELPQDSLKLSSDDNVWEPCQCLIRETDDESPRSPRKGHWKQSVDGRCGWPDSWFWALDDPDDNQD